MFVIDKQSIPMLTDEGAGYILVGGKLSAELREIDSLAKVCNLIPTTKFWNILEAKHDHEDADVLSVFRLELLGELPHGLECSDDLGPGVVEEDLDLIDVQRCGVKELTFDFLSHVFG